MSDVLPIAATFGAVLFLVVWSSGLLRKLDLIGASELIRWGSWILAMAGPAILIAGYVVRAPLVISLLGVLPVLVLTVLVERLHSIPGGFNSKAALQSEWTWLVLRRTAYPATPIDFADMRRRLERLDRLRFPETDEFISLAQDEFAEWMDGTARDEASFQRRSMRMKVLAERMWGRFGTEDMVTDR
jgi:hypothetical protein